MADFARYRLTAGYPPADLEGVDHFALQAAIDHVAALGGGTVQIRPGRYLLRNALRLRSGVRVEGAGADTLLVKAAEFGSELVDDTDWYDGVVRVADATGFRVGDGVVVQGEVPFGGSSGLHKVKRTILAIEGNRLDLGEPLGRNFWVDYQARVSTLFPLLYGEPVHDVEIADLRLDGNRAENSFLDGNHDGCIFLQHARRVSIERVTAQGNHGDGISWQVAHDVTVRDGEVFDCAGLGLHPGSGSLRPVMTGNRLHHNRLGLFFCWGVKDGLAESNQIHDNATHGVSLGHRDTDNLLRANRIERNGETGILLRVEGHDRDQPQRLPHGNRIEGNHLVDNGGAANGYGIHLTGAVTGTVLEGNHLADSGAGLQRVGIRIEAEVGEVTLAANTFAGLAVELDDQRPGR